MATCQRAQRCARNSSTRQLPMEQGPRGNPGSGRESLRPSRQGSGGGRWMAGSGRIGRSVGTRSHPASPFGLFSTPAQMWAATLTQAHGRPAHRTSNRSHSCQACEIPLATRTTRWYCASWQDGFQGDGSSPYPGKPFRHGHSHPDEGTAMQVSADSQISSSSGERPTDRTEGQADRATCCVRIPVPSYPWAIPSTGT